MFRVNPPAYLNKSLSSAWVHRNSRKFEDIVKDSKEIDANLKLIKDFVVRKIIPETTNDNFNLVERFWLIIFENNLHRKTQKPYFHLLVETKNFKVLELLLRYQPNLRRNDYHGNSFLHILCKKEWTDYIECYQKWMDLLLKHKDIDINSLNHHYETPMDLAIDSGNRWAVMALFKSRKMLYLGHISGSGNSTIIKERLIKRYPDLKDIADAKYQTCDDRIFTISKLHKWLKMNDKTFLREFSIAMTDPFLNQELSNIFYIFLQEACYRMFSGAIKLLINYGADPHEIDEWNDFRSAIHIVLETGHYGCISSILELPNSTFLSEPAITEFLKLGGYLGTKTKNDLLLNKLPGNRLEKLLDSKIMPMFPSMKTNDCRIPIGSQNFDVTAQTYLFDCKILQCPAHMYKKNNMLNHGTYLLKLISENPDQRRLLTHPVFASFILKRWERLKILFTINFLFYTLLTFFLTFNILWTSIRRENMIITMRVVQSLLICFMLVREIFQACIQKFQYFTQCENYLEITIISLGGYLSLSDGADSEIRRHFGAVTILLSWLGFLILLGKHPLFSVQVEMFLIVLSSFIKFLSVYLVLIFAFALSFFVLFNECGSSCPKEFLNVGLALFKTLIMVSGEFQSTDIPFPNHPGTAHLLFILFVFLVAIVLLNLLNGLAVYDTQKIKEDALLHTYVSRVRYLAQLDFLLFGMRDWKFLDNVLEGFLITNYVIIVELRDICDNGGVFHSVERFFNLNMSGFRDITQVAEKILERNSVNQKTRSRHDDNIGEIMGELNVRMKQIEVKLDILLSRKFHQRGSF